MKIVRLFRAANTARLGVYLLALWKLVRHADTPRLPKLIAVAVIAYAVSPIDLIPDFIPVLGMLDDLILLPLGVALVVKLTPAPHWRAMLAEAEAEASREKLPTLWWGAAAIVLLWVVLLGLLAWWLANSFVAA